MSVNVKQNGNLTTVANNVSITQANWNDRGNTNKNTCIKNQPATLTTLEQISANTDANALAGANAVKELNDSLEQMKVSFQDGCNAIYNAVVAKGVTPKSKSPADLATAISGITTDVKHSVYAKIINYKSNDTAQIGLYVDGVCKATGTHGSLKMIAEYPMSAVQV